MKDSLKRIVNSHSDFVGQTFFAPLGGLCGEFFLRSRHGEYQYSPQRPLRGAEESQQSKQALADRLRPKPSILLNEFSRKVAVNTGASRQVS